MPAPRVMGVASRKLKRAVVSRVRPKASPADIVAPERLIPGSRAAACDRPMISARPGPTWSRSRCFDP